MTNRLNYLMRSENNHNISALIQARMVSKRLPGKALLDIDGLTAIERVVNSLKPSKFIDNIIITTTREPGDDAIVELARAKKVPFFRGDSKNIVKRFLGASEKFGSDIIVRVTGDCPLISCGIADYLIKSHFKNEAEYTVIELEHVPVGISPEIISRSALEKLAGFNLDFDYSEYLTFYFKNNPGIFSINIAPAPEAYRFPEYRLTLDYEEDLKMFNALFKKLRENKLANSLPNALKILKRHQKIAQINSHLTLRYKSNKELIKQLNEATKIHH